MEAQRQGADRPGSATNDTATSGPGAGRDGRLRVGILGATGYVGAELVRLLERHPGVRIVGLAARNREGLAVGEAFAHLAETGHRIDGALPDPRDLDAVFVALPHGQAAAIAPELAGQGVLVVDLGPDFRLADADDYPRWYSFEHPAPELLPGGAGRRGDPADGRYPVAAAVYGLPELHRDELRTARLIGSPGCYPTAAILALAPLARAKLLADVVVDAKSGVSGAGREPKLETHFGEANESVRAYGLGGHRHLAEMRQELRLLGAPPEVVAGLLFTPHLVPMTRGLLATCHVRPTRPVAQDELDELFGAAYADEPCVQVTPESPATKTVLGSNLLRVHAHVDGPTGRLVVLGAIDNLVKGAAGQAVQSFNVAAGFPETTALEQLPLYP